MGGWEGSGRLEPLTCLGFGFLGDGEQDLLAGEGGTDASGNPVLADIGVHLMKRVRKHFKDKDISADVKYIDPTYMIRACRANASDSIVCAVLGQNAVSGGAGVLCSIISCRHNVSSRFFSRGSNESRVSTLSNSN